MTELEQEIRHYVKRRDLLDTDTAAILKIVAQCLGASIPPEGDIGDWRLANAFRDSVLSRADGILNGCPVWHGWVVVEAFIAGMRAVREKIISPPS